jgi:hypothetical protein
MKARIELLTPTVSFMSGGLQASRDSRSSGLPCEFLESAHVSENDAAASGAHPAGALPRLQVLVHHLPRQSEELGQLLLRDRELRAVHRIATEAGGQAQQPLGEPRRNAQERRILHQLCRPAHTLAEKLNQVSRKRRLGRQQLEKTLAAQNDQLGPCQRGRGGSAGLAIEQGDFSERIAGPHDIEKHLPPSGPACADPYSATHDPAQGVARIPPHEYHSSLCIRLTGRQGCYPLDSFRPQPAEELVALDDYFRCQCHSE